MVRGANPSSSAVYSMDLEAQAQAWIEELTGEAFQGEFAEELRDGRRLCNLMNAVKPGCIRRVNNSPGMPFKQMENISNFLKACRVVGVPEYSLFETVDLFELKDLGLVVKCLHALGGAVQLSCPDFKGPHLGLKPAQKTPPKKGTSGKPWSTPCAPQAAAAAAVVVSSRDSYVSPADSSTAISPAAGTSAHASQVPGGSLVRDEPSPARGSSAPALPPFDSSAAVSAIAAIPSVNDSAASPLPPPPFDQAATRWDPSESQNHLSHLMARADPSTGECGLPPPPAYREPGEWGAQQPPPHSGNAAVTTQAGELSSQFSESVRVADSVVRGNSISPRGPTGSGGNGGDRQARTKSPPYSPAGRGGGWRQGEGRSKSPLNNKHGVSAASAASTTTVSAKSFSPTRSEPASLSPRSPASSSATPRTESVVANTRGGGFGLDAELAAKREANYDYQSEHEAQEWIEDVTGEAFVDEFGEELRNGRRLCALINAIKPGSVRRVNDSRMPFKQMENISNFLKACRAVGVAEYSLFETVDLFEGKDLGLVVRCLHALGQTVQKSCPEYDGPRLGVKQTDANKRAWTAEQQLQQMMESSGAMSQLMAGSSKTMERGNVIKEGVTFGANSSGTGDATVPARWTMGSQATMERTNISKSGPTFGAEYAGTGDPNGSSSQFTRGYR